MNAAPAEGGYVLVLSWVLNVLKASSFCGCWKSPAVHNPSGSHDRDASSLLYLISASLAAGSSLSP